MKTAHVDSQDKTLCLPPITEKKKQPIHAVAKKRFEPALPSIYEKSIEKKVEPLKVKIAKPVKERALANYALVDQLGNRSLVIKGISFRPKRYLPTFGHV